jgi:predicted peroxiredoxin
MSKKLVFILTHGPDEAEKVTVPFTMAVACQAAGAEVAIGLQGAGAALAARGAADRVAFPGCAPLKELVETFRDAGGKMYTCEPPLDARGIAQNDLVVGVKVVGSHDFAELYIGADNILVY